MTRTSVSMTGNWFMRSSAPLTLIQNNRKSVQIAHRAHADVEIGEADPDQADPRPLHVPAVEAAHAGVRRLARPAGPTSRRARRRPGAAASGSRTCRAEEDDVQREHDRADADAELGRRAAASTRARRREPHRDPGVVGQDADEDDRDVQEVAVDVLDDEREPVARRGTSSAARRPRSRAGRPRTPCSRRRGSSSR